MKGITAQREVLKIINEEGLDSKSRKRSRVYRRQYLMWFLKQVTHMSLEDIGDLFNRDHATVIHAIRSVDHSMVVNDQLFFDYISDIKNRLDEFGFKKPKIKRREDGKRVISIYLSSDEYNSLLDAADSAGMTMYHFVLDCVRGERSLINNSGIC